MKAVLLISHGSRIPTTEQEIKGFVDQLRQQSSISIIEYAFLEIAHPNIPEGIDLCVDQGATEIIVLLNFLNSGKHVDEDIPRIINDVRKKYPEVSITITQPIGKTKGLIDLFLKMIERSAQS